MVPNGWKLTSLGEVCSGSLQTGPFGSQLHAHEYTDEGVPVLMPKDLINYRANNESAAKIPEHRADDLKKHALQSGDLLFSRRGDVARFALIESDYPRSLCGTGCLKATPNKAHSPLFLSYFLQKNAVKKWLEQNAVGQTMPNMNTAILAELPLMVASSREEEDKIAKILSTWDKAISTTEKLIETSKQQKKALMQQLLTGKKRLVNPETGEVFEGEWEEVKLGDVLTKITNGLTYDSKATEGLPVSRIETISTGKINHSKVGYAPNNDRTIKFKLQYGDILYSHINSLDHIGRVAYFLNDKTLYHGMNLLLLRSSKMVSSKFMYFLLSSSVGKSFASSHAKSAVNQASISTTDLKSFKVSLPILSEQQKIASVLTVADKEIDMLESKLAHFKQEKKALMQQLLTGKRRVKVAEAEAA